MTAPAADRRDRQGIALVLSLVAIIVVGGIIAALFASVMLEQRVADVTRQQNRAFAVADAAAGEVIGNWNGGTLNNMAVGAVQTVSGTSPGGSGSYEGSITRLNNEIYLVDVTGRDRGSRARQRIAWLVKLRAVTFNANAALTMRGAGNLGGSANVSGIDRNPAGWTDCPPAVNNMPGILHPDTSLLDFTGGGGGGGGRGGAPGSVGCSSPGGLCIEGSPGGLREDPLAADTVSYFNYGEPDWQALASAATTVLTGGTLNGMQPSASGGACNRADLNNWGEPSRPSAVPACEGYFPIIYISGNTEIQNGRGQGVLMVNGDLWIRGNFTFNGIIIVRNQFRNTGTPVITGGVLAANVDLEPVLGLGNVEIGYSSCAIQKAQQNSALGAPFRSRGWTQVY